MLEKLTTEARNPADAQLDSAFCAATCSTHESRGPTGPAGRGTTIGCHCGHRRDRRTHATGRTFDLCRCGTSGRLGVLDAAECPPTFNTHPDQVAAIIAGGSSRLVRAAEGAEDRLDDAIRDFVITTWVRRTLSWASPPAVELPILWCLALCSRTRCLHHRVGLQRRQRN